MKIDRLEFYLVAMPLLYPWRTAYGEDHAIHAMLCRMCSGSVQAWGETSPLAAPCYSSEWAGGVFQVAQHWLGPAIVGQTIDDGNGGKRSRKVLSPGNVANRFLELAMYEAFPDAYGASGSPQSRPY